MPTFAPGFRLAFDRDGSAVYRYNYDGTPNHPPVADWKKINNEAEDSIDLTQPNIIQQNERSSLLAIVFPAPTDLLGMFLAVNGGMNLGYHLRYFEASVDTSNGLDGTWTIVRDMDQFEAAQTVMANYRTNIYPLNLTDIMGVRVVKVGQIYTATIKALHLYAAQQETFLKFWHPTLDQEIPVDQLDWGTVYAGEVHTREFRIKNIRGLTANNVSLDALTYSPNDTNSTYHEFSLDGSTWARPLDLGNIAPGAISPVVTVRYSPPLDAVVSTYASQVSAIPASWT